MKLLTLLVSLFLVLHIQAQTRTVTGTVLNEKGAPLSNASVTVKGSGQGTSTDGKGSFSLSIPSRVKVLVISSVGYADREIALGNSGNYSITMQVAAKEISEVVVTAYGTTQKKAFTGTAAVISNEKIKDLQATTFADILQGNASGVLAISSSGQPGEAPTIRIRGVGSFNASNDPLILVDGSPYSGTFSSINPGDIETVTILKDASSTSIYGSRAANGIIQITTKRGSGRSRIAFSSVTGFSKRAVTDYKTVNAAQYDELYWEALRNDAVANPALLTQFGAASPEAYATAQLVPRTVYNPFNVAQPVGLNGKIDPNAKLLWSDNWVDAVSRVGVRNDLNLNVSGSDPSNTVRYYLSGGVLGDQGVIQHSVFKRYSGRAKVDATPAKWFRIGMISSLASSSQNYPYQGNAAASNELSFARTIAPIYPIYLRDAATGSYVPDGNGNKIFDYGNNSAVTGVLRPSTQNRPFIPGQNPMGTVSINPITYDRLTASGNVYAELDLIKGLTFRSQYSADYDQTDNNIFWNPFYGDGTTSGGYSYRGITLLYSQSFSNTLTYNKTMGIHHVNIVGGTEVFKQSTEFTSASATGFTFASPTQPSYGSTPSGSGTKTIFNLQSYFGRAGYDIADKYHLSLSLRTDGSTRFAENDRWGVFYATGVSWNIDREKFMSNIGFLSALKIKGSYGTSGNQALPGDFPYLGTYVAGDNINGAPGATISTVSNLALTWEKQKQMDVGIEYGLFRDRITGSIDYFDRRSSNLLFQRPLPNSTGINSISDNVGGVRNYGLEFELTTVNISHKDFTWRTSFNITRLKNVITTVAPGTTQVLGGSWYDWVLRQYAGVNLADGKPQWYMDDPATPGKKITTETYSQATLYYTGNGNRLSTYTGGITNFFKYKSFDFSVLASFAIGGKLYDADYATLMGGSISSTNLDKDIYKRWQSPSSPGDGKTPRLTTVTSNVGTSASTRFLYDASFLRVRNITMGYRVPESVLSKISISNARVFVDVQNAFTFFGGAKGTDPEAGINAQTGGFNSTVYKTVAIGLNIGF